MSKQLEWAEEFVANNRKRPFLDPAHQNLYDLAQAIIADAEG